MTTSYDNTATDADPPGAHANPGGMQETRLELPMLAPCAETDGGHKQIVNGDEAVTLDDTWENTPFRVGPLSNEDDSFVQAAWKAQTSDYAGS